MRAVDESTPTAVEDARQRAATLFESYGVALYRFARAVVHQPEAAEDAVQEAFVRLLEHLRRGGDSSNLKAWLFTVTANLCRDTLRARRRWLPWGPVHDRPVAPDDGRSMDRRQMLTLAAQRLKGRERMLLALRVQGHSYREVSDILGIREQSVGRLLARAVKRWQRECQRVMVNDHEQLPERTGTAGGGRPGR
jgi:RNA polymerase sigma-70 factor (ECF subfamily)